MYKGFYDLTSAMLTQTRNLDVVGNNMSNTATTGYKADRYADTTFDEVMRSRVGNKQKAPQALGTTTSYITALDEVYTDHSQGGLEPTGLPFDFAIEGEGYFAVQSAAGRVYTRNGSFMLDNQGYLYLAGQGRVLGQNGQPIYLGTDHITTLADGTITGADGRVLGTLGVFAFADPAQALEKTGEGMFISNVQPQAAGNMIIHHKMIERSNIDLVQQMTEMITCQRALQSASQLSKMYDQLMTKTSTELGRV
ncbi:flagellar hook-basal body protein [Agathobaculum desmolans]|uniref:flagellar hook-basal body protein n=1 Tax=Agathobaculum desmolans TaxID=39484 RepID=UPI00248D9F16|nr:flagellar hook-basal body protein [Agathobaculum desmolans]